jgi:hypothetical protein
MNFFQKSNPVKATEAELAQLDARRAALTTKLAVAVSSLVAAGTARREFLIAGDDTDAAGSKKLEAGIVGGERDVTALRDAIAEIDKRHADTGKRLAAARDMAEREAEAAKREAAAQKITEIAARLDGALDVVASLFDELTSTIPDGVMQIYENGFGSRPATPFETARQIVAEGLHRAADGLFEVTGAQGVSATVAVDLPLRYRRRDGALSPGIPKNDDSVRFDFASGSAEKLVVVPLRAVAINPFISNSTFSLPDRPACDSCW